MESAGEGGVVWTVPAPVVVPAATAPESEEAVIDVR